MNKKENFTPCCKQPNNYGIYCNDEMRVCGKCGWNPTVANKRRQQTIENLRSEEKCQA